VKLDDGDAPTFQALGLALLMQNKTKEGIQSLDRAIELAPKSAGAYLLRARAHTIASENEKAIADATTAIELAPTAASPLLTRASVYLAMKKLEQALEDVQQALTLDPGSVEARRMRAQLLAAAGKIEQAVTEFETLRDARPDDVEIVMAMAMMYSEAGRTDDAIKTYGEVLAVDAKQWRALRGRADVYLNRGEQAKALADYLAAEKIVPDNSGVLNNLAWLLATSPESSLRDGPKAIRLATKACEVTQYERAHILSTLAAAYAETGDYKTAIKWSQKAVERSDGNELPQLKEELASYKEGRPWREIKTAKDAVKPAEKSPAAPEPNP
jgi:tetratricopeptide (TPR) repeat protein